jgi:ribosomal protein S18 acetylase RimI-like enzyme
VGYALLEALVAALAQRGAPRIVLNVAARNPEAARLFAARGFRETMRELTREVAAPPRAPARRRAARRRSAGS